jgi:hypothetical protein
MIFVVKRVPDGAYVADMGKSGTGGSYTSRLQKAKTFGSKEEAEKDRCVGNEIVVSVEEEMKCPTR